MTWVRVCALGLAMLGGDGAALADGRADQSTQMAMSESADRAYRKTDTALNESYREIVARLADDAAVTRRLRTAHRAWIAFRDAECEFATADSGDGSIHPYLQASYRDGLTQARLKQLQAYLACQEGDLSCPVPAR